MGLVLTWWKLQSLSVRRAYSASPLAGADRAVIPLAVLVLVTRIGADTWQLCQAWTGSSVSRSAIQSGLIFLCAWTLGLLTAVFPFLAAAWRSGAGFPGVRLRGAPVSPLVLWWGDRGGIFSQGFFWGIWALVLVCLIPGCLTIGGSGAWWLVPGVLGSWAAGLLLTLVPGNLGRYTGFVLAGLIGAVLVNPQFLQIGGQFSLQAAGMVFPLEHPAAGVPSIPSASSSGSGLPVPGSSEARGWAAALVAVAAFVAFFLGREQFNVFRRWGASSVRFFLSPLGLGAAFPVRNLGSLRLILPYAGAAVPVFWWAGFDAAVLVLSLGFFQTVLASWIAPLTSLHLPTRENGDSPALAVFGLPCAVLIILGAVDFRGSADPSVVRAASVVLGLAALGGLLFFSAMRRRLVLDWEQQKPVVLKTFQE